MRTAYEAQLDALITQLADVCKTAAAAMRCATQSLLQADLALAEQVIGGQEEISAASVRVEEAGLRLLCLYAPVARDLRAIVSSVQIVADVERMGALALQVANFARRRHPRHALPDEVNGHIAEMGRIAVGLGDDAHEVIVSRDPDRAQRMWMGGDAIGDLHRQLLTVTMGRRWKHGMAVGVDVTLSSRHYERFAHYAVGISRRVVFQVTGQMPASQLKLV